MIATFDTLQFPQWTFLAIGNIVAVGKIKYVTRSLPPGKDKSSALDFHTIRPLKV